MKERPQGTDAPRPNVLWDVVTPTGSLGSRVVLH